MNLTRFGKNILFAAILFLLAASINYVDLPLTDRFEEYLSFVLTSEFDYRGWLERAGATELWAGASRWFDWIPWQGGEPTGEQVMQGGSLGSVQ